MGIGGQSAFVDGPGWETPAADQTWPVLSCVPLPSPNLPPRLHRLMHFIEPCLRCKKDENQDIAKSHYADKLVF